MRKKNKDFITRDNVTISLQNAQQMMTRDYVWRLGINSTDAHSASSGCQ